LKDAAGNLIERFATGKNTTDKGQKVSFLGFINLTLKV
jgi:hypothetical protein